MPNPTTFAEFLKNLSNNKYDNKFFSFAKLRDCTDLERNLDGKISLDRTQQEQLAKAMFHNKQIVTINIFYTELEPHPNGSSTYSSNWLENCDNYSKKIFREKIDFQDFREDEKCFYFIELCAERNRAQKILEEHQSLGAIEKLIEQKRQELSSTTENNGVVEPNTFADYLQRVNENRNTSMVFNLPWNIDGYPDVQKVNSKAVLSEEQWKQYAQAMVNNIHFTNMNHFLELEQFVKHSPIINSCIELIKLCVDRNFLKKTRYKETLEEKVFASFTLEESLLIEPNPVEPTSSNKISKIEIILVVSGILLTVAGGVLATTGIFSPLGVGLSLVGYKLMAMSAVTTGLVNFGIVVAFEALILSIGMAVKSVLSTCFGAKAAHVVSDEALAKQEKADNENVMSSEQSVKPELSTKTGYSLTEVLGCFSHLFTCCSPKRAVRIVEDKPILAATPSQKSLS